MAEKINREATLAFLNKINGVEGFDPWDVVKESSTGADGNGVTAYLPLIYKKAWARAKYPNHRCHAEIKGMKDGYVSAYARFYPSNEPGVEFTGEGFAFISVDLNNPDRGKAENDALLMALGSAKSRAYTDAGFGLQFWTDDVMDDMQLNASIAEKVQKEIAETAKTENYSPIEVSSATSEPPAETGRRTQTEILIEENEKLKKLLNSLDEIKGVGNKTAMETARSKWDKIQKSMLSRMEKPAVKKALLDPSLNVITMTFDEAWDNAGRTSSVEAMANVYAAAEEEMEREREAAAIDFPMNPPEPVATASPIPVNPSPIAVVVSKEAPTEEAEQLSFVEEMTLEEARNTVSSIDSPAYNGKTIGEIYGKSKNLLFVLLDKTEQEKERLAITKVIKSDEDLMAYAERNGKALSA